MIFPRAYRGGVKIRNKYIIYVGGKRGKENENIVSHSKNSFMTRPPTEYSNNGYLNLLKKYA